MKLLELNESISFGTIFKQEELDLFSKISGDNNPIHTVEYHQNNPDSKGVIVHGMLALARFGSYLGGVFPGYGTINVSRSAQFQKPVYVGHNYYLSITLLNVDTSKNTATIKLLLKNEDNQVCIEGDTEVMNDKVFTIDNYPDKENSVVEGFEIIKLPEPKDTSNFTLHQALANRRSVRYIQKTEIDQQTLSNLLWSACGVTQSKVLESGKIANLFTNPTASNHQEVEIYLLNAEGVFLYNPLQHELIKHKHGDYRSMIGKLPMFKMAPVSLCLVSNISKMVHYTDTFRKNLYSSMDIGYVSENIYLYCSANNMATCACGQIAREELSQLLGLSNAKVMLVHPIGIRKRK